MVWLLKIYSTVSSVNSGHVLCQVVLPIECFPTNTTAVDKMSGKVNCFDMVLEVAFPCVRLSTGLADVIARQGVSLDVLLEDTQVRT